MANPGDPQPMVQIDWTRSGFFDGPYDDVTANVLADPGITVESGMDQGRPLRPPMIGAADLTLINESGVYSLQDPRSPLYQLVRPATPIQISTHAGVAVGYRSHTSYRAHIRYRGRPVYTFHKGVLADIQQTASWGHKQVAIRSLSLASKLRGQRVTTPVYTGIRTDEALTYILNAVGWPTTDRVIALGDTTLLYWWADDRDAWEAAVELLEAEGPGALYEDGAGWIHFENRGYRALTARSTTDQALLSDIVEPGTDGWYSDLEYEPNWDAIVNYATYRTVRRVLGGVQQVWEYGASLSMTAGDIFYIWVRPSDPVLGAIAPLESTDYAISGGTVSMTISTTSGAAILLTITALSGSPVITGVTSTGLQLRAQPLARFDEGVVSNQGDANQQTSVALYGLRTAEVGGWPEVSFAQAQGVVNAVVTRRQFQLPTVTLTMRNSDDAHLALLFERVVSDRLRVLNRALGLDIDVWVESLRFELSGSSPMLVGKISCEATVALIPGALWDVGIWDVSVWSD